MADGQKALTKKNRRRVVMKEDLTAWGKGILYLAVKPLKFLFVTLPKWTNCNVAHRKYWVIEKTLLEDDGARCKKCRREFLVPPYSSYPNLVTQIGKTTRRN